MTDQPPRRVVVAHPMTLRARQRAPGTGGRAPASTAPTDRLRDIDEQTELGLVLVRSLVRAQLTLALRLAAVFGCVLGGLPLLFAVAPAVRDARVLGIDLPWLLLGVLVFPLFVAGGWLYVRMSERNERDFVEIVEDS
jgi:hypothetical protein